MAATISRQVYIPENLDVDELIAFCPPTEVQNFKAQHLKYIIGLITSIPATKKDIDTPDGFVPIHAHTLQLRVKNYREYLNYLLRAKVFDTDNHYRPGEKSRGFQFRSSYTTKARAVVIQLKATKAWKSKDHVLSPEDRMKYKHLLPHYQNLLIDDEAYTFIGEDLRRKEANPSLRDKVLEQFEYKSIIDASGRKKNIRIPIPEGFKDPYRQYSCSLLNIDSIKSKNFRISIDSNVHRLHSTLSNMWSPVRNFITYQGETLVSIDIKNSQPYISVALLRKECWRQLSYFNRFIPIKHLKSNINYYVMLGKVAELQASSEFQEYVSLVSSGNFYDVFSQMVLEKTGTIYQSKKEIKEVIFTVLFTANRFIYQDEAEPKRIFQAMFPKIYDIFNEIKKDDKTILPRLLQNIESHLVLDVITKRIARERRSLPIFTIHDSIVTTEGNEGYIQQVMTEELTKAIGVSPTLSVEIWKPENAKFNDKTSYILNAIHTA